GKLYTDPNAPLTDRGLKQAYALAQWLPAVGPHLLLTSSSKRVRSTADLIAQALCVEPIVIEGLDEWYVGDWEGKTYLEIKKSQPELYSCWSANPIDNAPPGGESIAQLCRRTERKVQELLVSYEGSRLILVTHAGVIRGILVYALGIPVANFWRMSIPAGSITRVDFSNNFATLRFACLQPGNDIAALE
ncbi:MAG: histidine phosphatase family protein, partial [Candidatus Melainabacteria bacterium]|nr:histidine phosphatase family protein [Candidatus Melainabacteria bacterium]